MFCPNCGKKLEDGAKFCAYCGNVTDTKTVEVQSTPKKEAVRNKKGGKLIAIAVTAVVIATAAFIGFNSIKGDEPELQQQPQAEQNSEQQLQEPEFVMFDTDEALFIRYNDTGYMHALEKKAVYGGSGGMSSEMYSYYDEESGYLFYPSNMNSDYGVYIYRTKPSSEGAQSGQMNSRMVAKKAQYGKFTVCAKGETVYYINTDDDFYCNINGEDKLVCEGVERFMICESSGTYLFAEKTNTDGMQKVYRFNPETFEYELEFSCKNEYDTDDGIIFTEDLTNLVFSDSEGGVWALSDDGTKNKVLTLGEGQRFSNSYYNYVSGINTTMAEDCIYFTVNKSVTTAYKDMIEDDLGSVGDYNGISTQKLRDYLASESFTETLYDVYCVADAEARLICAGAEYAYIEEDAILYRERPADRKIKLSTITEIMNENFSGRVSSGDTKGALSGAVYYLVNNENNTVCIALDGEVYKTDIGSRVIGLHYDAENSFAYIGVEKNADTFTESWYRCTLKGNTVEKVEQLVDDVDNLWVDEQGNYIYIDNIKYSQTSEASSGDLYVNGSFIDSNVYYMYHSYTEDITVLEDSVIYFKDFDEADWCGTLAIYTPDKGVAVAEKAVYYLAPDAENIFYIADYDMVNGTGSIKKYNAQGEAELICSDVHNIFVP